MSALPFPLVRISWVDSTGPYGWNSLKHAISKDDMTIETIGWLLYEAPDRVTVAAHVAVFGDDDRQVDGVITIPVCAITSRSVIAEPDKS